MENVVSLGPMEFRMTGAVTARMPELQPHARFEADGQSVEVVEESGHVFLVVDHRRDEDAPARVEWWPLAGEAEGGVAGLFLLCDSLRDGHVQEPPGLVSLARYVDRSVA